MVFLENHIHLFSHRQLKNLSILYSGLRVFRLGKDDHNVLDGHHEPQIQRVLALSLRGQAQKFVAYE